MHSTHLCSGPTLPLCPFLQCFQIQTKPLLVIRVFVQSLPLPFRGKTVQACTGSPTMATAAMRAGMLVELPREMLLDDDCPEGIDDSAHGNSARCGSDSPPAETASKTPGFMERVQARVRPDADYREEIVKSIFGEVGTPVEGDRSLLCLSLIHI